MTNKRNEPQEPLTAAQRVRKASKHGPKRATNKRSEVRLENLTGPRGAWDDTQEIPRDKIAFLAEAMIGAGGNQRAYGAAECIAQDARRYVHAYRAWRTENDATAAAHIEAGGQLAYALRNHLEVMGERAELFIGASMKEDEPARRFLAERQAAMPLLLGMEAAARKVHRPKRRPINAAAQNFLRGSIRTWRVIVGDMPSPPARQMGDDARPYALHNILKALVETAAGEIPEHRQMMAQLNAKAFYAAYNSVRAEFDAYPSIAR